MSAQDLADRCEEMGHPIPRNVIANMESGRRANLPLVDVMVLARALRTNPICLIYPIGYVAEVQRLHQVEHLEHGEAGPISATVHWLNLVSISINGRNSATAMNPTTRPTHTT